MGPISVLCFISTGSIYGIWARYCIIAINETWGKGYWGRWLLEYARIRSNNCWEIRKRQVYYLYYLYNLSVYLHSPPILLYNQFINYNNLILLLSLWIRLEKRTSLILEWLSNLLQAKDDESKNLFWGELTHSLISSYSPTPKEVL